MLFRSGTQNGAAPLLLFLCGFFYLPSLYFTFHLLCLPRCKLSLPVLALIERENIRQNTTGDGLDLMLWYGGVIDQLFLSVQRIPPSGLLASSYWSHCCYQSVGGFAPSTILLQIPLQNPTSPSFPFREKQKRASIGSVATLP